MRKIQRQLEVRIKNGEQAERVILDLAKRYELSMMLCDMLLLTIK